MKVTTERLEKSRVALQFEIEPTVLEKSLDRAYRRIVNRTNIPGFRRGKAPRVMVERFVGKAALLEEALDILVPEAYTEAIQEQSIAALGRPEFEILEVEPQVSFKATVAIEPTVELGDYKTVSLTMEVPRVTDAKVDEVIEQLRTNYTPWEPVERPIEFGDMVIIGIESSLLNGDAKETFINQPDATYIVTAGRREPVPEFAEALIGVERGASKEFVLPLPEDPAKTVEFNVTVKEVKEKHELALDDEFAKTVDAEYNTFQELLDKVRSNLVAQSERESRSAHDLAMLDALAAVSKLEFPDMMVDHEIEHIIETDRTLPRDPQGRIDQVLEVLGQTMVEFKERFREQAEKRVVRSLVLQNFARAEAIEVGAEEIDAEIETLVGSAGDQQPLFRQYLQREERRAALMDTLMTRKSLQRLFDLTSTSVEVDPPPPTADEPEAAAANESSEPEAAAAPA
ncbi:MAG: trigger factor [Dehalococcoidia bacterium]|nr:trigger factor [Dehalococcoidia bacterium]